MQATMKAPADLLLLPQWVVPVETEGALADHAVVVQDGRILDVLPADAAQARYDAAQSACGGSAGDLPLVPWLTARIWPAEKQHVSAAFARDGTLLAAAAMLA